MISSAVTRADDAVAPRDDDGAGVHGHLLLESRADERRARVEERHRLALHVRAHQRAVGVVVLEERNERRGDRDELLGRDVHVVDAIRRRERHVALLRAQSTSSSTNVPSALSGAFACAMIASSSRLASSHAISSVHLAVLHDAVRRLDEAEIVDARVAARAT